MSNENMPDVAGQKFERVATIEVRENPLPTLEDLERVADATGEPVDKLVEEAEAEDNNTFEISFSSEAPYQRWFGMEVLGHEPGEVDMEWAASGNAPLLVDHERSDLVGVVEKAWVENGRGKASIRFGQSPRAR